MSSPNSAPATKADLNRMSDAITSTLTHAINKAVGDLNREIEPIAAGLGRAQADIREMKTGMATKADLNLVRGAFGDLDRKIDRVAVEVVRNQADIREIKGVLATSIATKDDIGRVMTAIDSFAGKSQNAERAMVFHGQTLTEVEVKLKDYEQRIKTLETRPGE